MEQPLVLNSKNSVDIWFVKGQNLVIVPPIFDNRVVAYQLVKKEKAIKNPVKQPNS